MAGYCGFGGKSAWSACKIAAVVPVRAGIVKQYATLLIWSRLYIPAFALTNRFAGLTMKNWARDC